jgi:hypothetical protein
VSDIILVTIIYGGQYPGHMLFVGDVIGHFEIIWSTVGDVVGGIIRLHVTQLHEMSSGARGMRASRKRCSLVVVLEICI